MERAGLGTTVLLGLAGAGIAALVVDHVASAPGDSLVDRFAQALSSKKSVSGPQLAAPQYYPAALPGHGHHPRATPRVVRELLGHRLGLAIPAMISKADLAALLARFQAAVGLQPTGAPDAATMSALGARAPSVHARVGAPPTAAWEREAAPLGQAATDIISHALAVETDPKTLSDLGAALSGAGFPKTAAAARKRAASFPAHAAGWWP